MNVIMLKRLHISCTLVTISCIVLVSCFFLLPSDLVVAASWNPESIIKMYVTKNYPWKEVEVTGVQVIGKVPVEVPEKINVEKGPIGKAVFSFLFKTDRRVMVKANVRAFDSVVKSRRPFKKGHVLRYQDIYVSGMDIRKMPKSSVKNPELIIGKSLKRSIIANIPIVEDMVEKSQLVKRGKMVMLMIRHKGLNITTAGKTKEKGYVGTTVRAMNLSSKKEVSGVLIDENTVKVEL